MSDKNESGNETQVTPPPMPELSQPRLIKESQDPTKIKNK